MAWRDDLVAAKQAVHDTFAYAATLHHPTEGDTPVNVKWHKAGDTVGDSGRAQVVIEEHEIVFLLSEISVAVPARDMEITLPDGRFQLIDRFPPGQIQQTWTAAPV